MALRKAGDYMAEFANQRSSQPKKSNNNSGNYSSFQSSGDIAGSYRGRGPEFNQETKGNNLRTLQHSATNQMQQAKYQGIGSGIAQTAIDNAAKNKYINTEALDQRIQSREMYNKAAGTVAFSDIFGDLWGSKNPEWAQPEPGKPIEKPDFEEMYDKYNPMED